MPLMTTNMQLLFQQSQIQTLASAMNVTVPPRTGYPCDVSPPMQGTTAPLLRDVTLYQLRVNLPGVHPSELQVDLQVLPNLCSRLGSVRRHAAILTVRVMGRVGVPGRCTRPTVPPSLRRRFVLDAHVLDLPNLKAQLVDGILVVTVPRRPIPTCLAGP